MKLLVINSNLNPGSNTRILADIACEYLEDANVEFEFMDLLELDLPICDGDSVFKLDSVINLELKLRTFDAIIIATPVYNYNVNAALKNFIELTGTGWIDKVVGFICTAGGRRSYMSVQSFAGTLMLDFRCLIIPRFVFAISEDFLKDKLQNQEIIKRIKQLVDTTLRLTGSWKKSEL